MMTDPISVLLTRIRNAGMARHARMTCLASNLKKVVAPERDIVNRLSRGESLFVSKPMLFYFRDVYDHMFRFHLNLDAHREMLANTLETYNSAQANQTNEVVKLLASG